MLYSHFLLIWPFGRNVLLVDGVARHLRLDLFFKRVEAEGGPMHLGCGQEQREDGHGHRRGLWLVYSRAYCWACLTWGGVKLKRIAVGIT